MPRQSKARSASTERAVPHECRCSSRQPPPQTAPRELQVKTMDAIPEEWIRNYVADDSRPLCGESYNHTATTFAPLTQNLPKYLRIHKNLAQVRSLISLVPDQELRGWLAPLCESYNHTATTFAPLTQNLP